MFPKPSPIGYTIYSKSECIFCDKAKLLLRDYECTIIDCDDYITNNKTDFLDFVKVICNMEYTTVPVIFYNGLFIGGYSELATFL